MKNFLENDLEKSPGERISLDTPLRRAI